MKKTKYESYLVGKLSKGCSLCPNGKKSVLYVTGLCPNKCFYCPLSDTRNQNDKQWINEKQIINFEETIDEIKLCKSKGVGITGGEPLVKLDRTIEYIKRLKQTFGKKFHIHMYTTMNLLTLNKIEKLYEAGLDELRVHPMYDNYSEIKRILIPELTDLKSKYNSSFGVEIPLIPDKKNEIKELVKLLYGFADFINLNELEISDNNSNSIIQKGYKISKDHNYGVEGSIGAGLDILNFIEKQNKKHYDKLNAHLCTCKLKDSYQLKNRLLNRAKSIKTKYDKIIDDFMLERYVIYPNKISLEKTKKERDFILQNEGPYIADLVYDISLILNDLKIDNIIEEQRVIFDKKKVNLILEKLKGLDISIYKVTEYPSVDKLMIENEQIK